MESYINDIRAARLIGRDFLDANPRQHLVFVQQGEITLAYDRSGHERIVGDVKHDAPASLTQQDAATRSVMGLCAMTQDELNSVLDGTACFECVFTENNETVVAFLNREQAAFCRIARSEFK